MPPVPGKHGPVGPKEGFSTTRLRPDFALLPGRGEHIKLEAQANYNVLAVRVAFSDTPIESSTAYYDRLLFFMNQYWSQVTEGAVTLTPTLWDSVFTLPHPMAYYGDDDRFQERVVFMIRDMVQLADSTVDFRSYQSIVIFHAGAGQEADVLDDSRQEIWSAFVTQEDMKTVLPDSTGAVGIKTNDAISPGNFYRVKEAVEVAETESQDGYVFGMTGVTCHEFGHQLGIPDLYDTTPGINGTSQGLGAWDIMATGVWNANGFVPAQPSAWSKAFLGVLTSARVLNDQSVTLSQVERQIGANPRLVEIPVTQSEYFLLENREQDSNHNGKFDFDDVNGDGSFDFYTDSYQGAEFDYFLPGEGTGSGILAYHVDESKLAGGLTNNVVNGDRDRKAIDVVEANGIQDLDDPPNGFNGGSPEDVWRAGWRNQWTPTTNPSTEAYGRIPTGISVTNISAAESLMTFGVSFSRQKAGWPVVLGGRARLGGAPLAADLNGDGVLELIVPIQRLNNSGALYVLEPDGNDFRDLDSNPTTRDAFITTFTGVASSPCVGDIDGDGTPEIVFETLDGSIYALHPDGTEVKDGDNNPGTLGVLVGPGFPGGQPILADLDGDGALEIIRGTFGSLGGSSLQAYRVTGAGVVAYSIPIGGSTPTPAAAGDLDGDGLPEIVIASQRITLGENTYQALSIANWDIFNDPLLPPEASEFLAYVVVRGAYSAPILADLNRDGKLEVVASDRDGSLHAFDFTFASHIPGDLPSQYITAKELPGWPTSPLDPGALSEVSIADLEHDGFPEVIHAGGNCKVAAVHYSGSPRSGYPVAARDPLAPADSTASWPPLIADVDGDGVLDVIPVLPDGARPAYRADGKRVAGFGELGSTGMGPPPILLDLDNDGTAEWVETFDQVPNDPRVQIEVRTTTIPASAVAWPQYRFGPTRAGLIPAGPAGPAPGTSILSQVYGFPNPSHSGTTFIHYRLSGDARSVRVKVMDPMGNVVAEPPTGAADLLGSAEHAIPWNHSSNASGIYLCRIEVESAGGSEVSFTKLAIVR